MKRSTVCTKCGAENYSWRSRCSHCGEDLHETERPAPRFQRRGAGFFLSCLSGLIGTGCFGFLTYIVTAGTEGGLRPQFQFLGLLAVPVAGLALIWKWPRADGIALIIASVLPHVGFMVIPQIGTDPMLAFGVAVAAVFTSLPLLVSGILFVASRR